MMQAFRNSAKPVGFVLTVAFLLWLVWDLSGLSGGGGLLTQTSVGKINGRTIEARAYSEAVQQATEAQQRQSPEPLGVAGVAQVRDQVWEQFIQQTMLEDEYRRRGIRVSSEEIAEVIRQVPPQELQGVPEFQTDGRFDMEKYQRWLTSPVGQGYVPILEARYRDELLRQKLFRGLVSTVAVSEPALWQRYRDEHEAATIGLAMVDPSADAGSVTVTDEEIQAHYRDHRSDFERKRTAFLSYIAMDRLPDASDTAAARARAAELRQEIVGGVPFEEVAQRESSDTVSGRNGGDLGEWTRGDFDPDFERAAAALALNQVSEPVLTAFGFHLIQITARNGDKVSGRHILVPIELAGDHRDFVDARADSLEALAADRLDRAVLDTASRALALPIQTTGPILEGTFATVPADAQVWAFQARSGEHSPVIETRAFFYVFRVDSLWAAGIPPLARIRGEVEAAVRTEKQKAAARTRAESLAQRVAQGESLEAAAAAMNLPYAVHGPFTRLTAPMRSNAARGAAFGVPVGGVSGVLEGPDGFHVLTVISRTPADSAAFAANIEQTRATALQAARQDFVRSYLASLRASAKITDNRADLFRTAAQAEAETPVAPAGPIP